MTLAEQLRQAEARITELQAESTRLGTELEQAQGQVTELTGASEALQQQNDELATERDRIQGELEAAQGELTEARGAAERLERQLALAPGQADVSGGAAVRDGSAGEGEGAAEQNEEPEATRQWREYLALKEARKWAEAERYWRAHEKSMREGQALAFETLSQDED